MDVLPLKFATVNPGNPPIQNAPLVFSTKKQTDKQANKENVNVKYLNVYV